MTYSEIREYEKEFNKDFDNFMKEFDLRMELKKLGINPSLKKLNLSKEQEIKLLEELLKQAKKVGFEMC